MKDINNFAVVILAAGKGKRMKDPEMPKVLVELAGKPLLGYVLEQAVKLNPEKIVVVVGHGKEKVIDYVNSFELDNVDFVEQEHQLGTGHATMQAGPKVCGYEGETLVLCGDVPFLSAETLQNFISQHREDDSDVSVLTATAPDPAGYGRILRDDNGSFQAIVEDKDAAEEQKNIDEINSGVFFVKTNLLFASLKSVSNNNAQQEYYLTDIVDILKEDSSVNAYKAASFDELMGVNSPDQLKEAEELVTEQ